LGDAHGRRFPVDWSAETLLQISTRFEDGVTVTVDAPAKLDTQGPVEVGASIG
jgi:hypothetical protein